MDASVPRPESTTQAWSPPLPEASGFEHRLVQTPGLRTHVASNGHGDPVVLLHGFPQYWWEWREVAPKIAAQGYRVVCPDLRSWGWSQADDPRMHRETLVEDLVAILDALGLQRVHLVGHDLGAVVASQFAYRYPQRVRSLVLLSVPPSFMTFSPALLPAFKHMPGMLMHRGGGSVEQLFGPTYVAKPMSAETIDGYLRVSARPGYDRAVRRLYRGAIVPEVMHLAKGDYKRTKLEPPTLAVFGRRDGPFKEETVVRICRGHERYADHFEYAFVDDAAHFMVDDAPDAVSRLIGDWIAKAT